MIENYKHLLMPALDRSGGTHDWLDIVEGVHSTKMQLWVNDEAAAITEIVVYPRKRVLNVFLAGGVLDQVMDMLESAKMWGVSQGCSDIMMSGRRGWIKPLGDKGWSEDFCVMSCPLRDAGL